MDTGRGFRVSGGCSDVDLVRGPRDHRPVVTRTETSTDCGCQSCSRLCHGIPGWFAPGEPTKAAAQLGVTLEELFRTELVIDHWEGGATVLAPAKVNQKTGALATWNSAFERGACRFLGPNGCRLSGEARPMECRMAFGDGCSRLAESQHGPGFRDRIQLDWQSNQSEVEAVRHLAVRSTLEFLEETLRAQLVDEYWGEVADHGGADAADGAEILAPAVGK